MQDKRLTTLACKDRPWHRNVFLWTLASRRGSWNTFYETIPFRNLPAKLLQKCNQNAGN